VSVKSKHTVTKLPGGTIYIQGEPKYVGRLPPPLDATKDAEVLEMIEDLCAVLCAGDAKN
jgi:hypothetical protein